LNIKTEEDLKKLKEKQGEHKTDDFIKKLKSFYKLSPQTEEKIVYFLNN
jgi:hypothetical protein